MSRCEITDVRLGPHFESRLEVRGLLSKRDGVIKHTCENTLTFARTVYEGKPMDEAQIQHWLQQIRSEEVDVNAEIYFNDHRFSGNNRLNMPLHQFMLAHAPETQANLRVFAEVMEQAGDVNLPRDYGSEQGHRSLRELFLYEKRDGLVQYYLNHPRVELDTPIYSRDFTLLNGCLLAMMGATPGPKEEACCYYASLLLERGALVSRAAERETHRTEGWNVGGVNKLRDFLKPYVDQWQEEWEFFVAGCLRPDEVTPTQLGHFYTLGHLEEALQPSHWQGQEARALLLYEHLPKWVQKEEPCLDERHALASHMRPDTLVAGWSTAITPQNEQKRTFSR